MTKTLTEQWRERTLPNGVYYLQYDNCFPFIYNSYQMIDLKKCKDSDKVEVLAPVPSYDEYKELVSKTEQLEKKLEIATKALKEYADSSNWYETDDFGISAVDQFACDDYGYNIADKALKEMEGVK